MSVEQPFVVVCLIVRSVQLQKTEDSAPDSIEFERLKEHLEPFFYVH